MIKYNVYLPGTIGRAGADIECFKFICGFFKNLEINAFAIFLVLLVENSFLITSCSRATSHWDVRGALKIKIEKRMSETRIYLELGR